MIRNKKELLFYILADRMMNRGSFHRTVIDRIRDWIIPDDILEYLIAMRKVSYYSHCVGRINKFKFIWYYRKTKLLGQKLGFSIGINSLGYGVSIPHYGTIVIGERPRVGNYAVLHTSTCISDNNKVIGNGLYLSTGAKITSEIILGNNVSVGANSVVNHTFAEDNILVAGMPAIRIKKTETWYERDGGPYANRVEHIEKLKERMGLA